jgi:hypothetical protein
VKFCVALPEVSGSWRDRDDSRRSGPAAGWGRAGRAPPAVGAVVGGQHTGRAADGADLCTGEGTAAVVGDAAGDRELRVGGSGCDDGREGDRPEVQAMGHGAL